MKRNLLTLMLLFAFVAGQAQLNDYFNDIKKTYDADNKKKLTEIAKIIKDVDSQNADIQQKYISGKISDALKSRKKVSKTYKEVYRKLFLIYENKLEALSKETEGDMATYVSYLINQAKNSFRISISERYVAFNTEKAEDAYNILNSAHKNELEAIDFQSRAFGVINGWIKEDFKVEKTNYSIENIYDNTITENFEVKDFNEVEISMPVNYTFNQTKQVKDSTSNISENTYDDNNYNNTSSVINNSEISENDNVSTSSIGTEFRIQIGTSILPASKSQIDRLNSTDLSVNVYKSKVYYKYTIGSFASYHEAKSYKNAYGLQKTYITEYKNGKEFKFYTKDI